MFHLNPSLKDRKKADVLVLPYWQEDKTAEAAFTSKELSKSLKHALNAPLQSKDFKAKEGETALVYIDDEPEARCLLLGFGKKDKQTEETLRRSFGQLTRYCMAKGFNEINLQVPEGLKLHRDALLRSIAEGLLLPNYVFDALKGQESKKADGDKLKVLHRVNLIGPKPAEISIFKEQEEIFEGVYLARDLVNGNADDVTPKFLTQVAKGIAEEFSSVSVTVFDKKRIEKEKMGLLLAVNRGSSSEPAFIILEYKGNKKSKDVTAIVGKGITFDTGGLNLKPTGSMETMKCDMGGAAAVLGVFRAAANLKLAVNLVGVIATTENSIDANSYKPGDVYLSHAGKTVEISNTDAEGRLVLADALSYTVKNIKPARVIDYATLTGAIDVALGNEATGLFSNNDELAKAIVQSGQRTHERVWQMPLWPEYRDLLKSDLADLKSTGGRGGGSITAAKFLEEFVGDVPFAHLDIASTAYLNEVKRYLPKFGTGIAVRLTIDFLKHLK